MKLIKLTAQIPDILQKLLNISLCLIAFALTILLLTETWYIISLVFFAPNPLDSQYAIAAELLVFFLYFEFIALIVKYFKSDYHFPLRYFIYIGITAVLRLIILDHEEATRTFWWALAILVMSCSLFIVNSRRVHKEH